MLMEDIYHWFGSDSLLARSVKPVPSLNDFDFDWSLQFTRWYSQSGRTQRKADRKFDAWLMSLLGLP